MQYRNIDKILDNEHIDLGDGIVTLKTGYSKEDKELFDNFVEAVNKYGYGIKSVIERERDNGN